MEKTQEKDLLTVTRKRDRFSLVSSAQPAPQPVAATRSSLRKMSKG